MNEESLFHLAQARPAAERAAFLTEACNADAALRRRVEALLRAHDSPDGFMSGSPLDRVAPAADQPTGGDDPAGPLPDFGPIAEGPGMQVGPYKLLEPIGEGGMGVVFLAEQTRPVRRQVALKVIKAGMDTRQVVARFEAERQALALMDHPNIAKVFDAGATATGRPYFVMELVKGVSITKFCDEHRLTLRQRLALFVQLCQGVQHAHQKGVIHRDLKPSNVLVALYDDKPVPKVIDFGVAKAAGASLTDRTMFTGFGSVVGTLEYMSPEQAHFNELDVDTRCDVYALGVLLYELLTGSTPLTTQRFRTAALQEALRIIREEEPPRPSTRLSASAAELPGVAANRAAAPAGLSGAVRGELDWIVMKALEKDRDRRYDTAVGFGRDVERYLADEPVLACQPSRRYRARKFARRNKLPLAALAAVASALVVGLVISATGLVQANRQRELAEANEARARREAARANAVSDFLQQMLRSADPDDVRGSDFTVRQLLDDFSGRAGGEELAAQPEVEAAVRTAIGVAYRRIGDLEKAQPHLERALALRRGLHGDGHETVASSLVELAWNQGEQGNLSEAEATARGAVEILRDRRVTGRPLLAALWTLQWVNNQQADWAEAQSVAAAAVAEADGSGTECAELASILHGLAFSLNQLSRFAEAEPPARRAVDLHRRLSGPTHPETAWGLSVLAESLVGQGRHDRAEPPLREALSIFRRHYRPGHKSVDLITEELRQVLQSRGDQAGLDELAAALVGDAADSARRTPAAAEPLMDLAVAQARAKQWAGAVENCEKACAIAGQPGSTDASRPRLLAGCDAVIAALAEAQRHPEAVRVLALAIALADSPGATATSPATRLVNSLRHNTLAFSLLPIGRDKDAGRAIRVAVDLKVALAKEFPRDAEIRYHLAHAYNGLSVIEEHAGNRDGAIAALTLAGDVLETIAAEDLAHVTAPAGAAVAPTATTTTAAAAFLPPWLATETGHTLSAFAARFSHMGEDARAEPLHRRTLRLFEGLGASQPAEPQFRLEQCLSHRALARVCETLGRPRDAQGHQDSAKQLYASLAAQFPDRPAYRQDEALSAWESARLLLRCGRADEAVAGYRVTVTLHERAVTEAPGEPVRGQRLTEVRGQLAAALVSAGAYEEAAAVAGELAPATWPGSRDAAGVLARSIEAARRDVGLAPERRETLVAAWTAQVERLLASAVKQCPAAEAGQLNNLAWSLVAGSDPLSRDPAAIRTAVGLAETAVGLEPDGGTCRNTLGVARYRAGEHERAVADLVQSMKLRGGGDSFEFFFLAMSHRQLGRDAEARDWYAKAVEWMDENRPADEELRRFRAEATALLDVKAQADE